MGDLSDRPEKNVDSSSKLTCICANELILRNHPYIISVCVNHSEQVELDIKVEAKENADQWRSNYNVYEIEKLTAKTGNFKSFETFVNMLENAINQKSSSLSIDLYTFDDLQSLGEKLQIPKKASNKKTSQKRYLMLIYNCEYDQIYYPLSLRYCGKPDPAVLIEQIRLLAVENQLLKSQLETKDKCSDFEQECLRLKKENDEYRQELVLLNSKEKDQQIEYLRQMILTTEQKFLKEQNHLKKFQIKKDQRYQTLLDQIELLKSSERQLKAKVKSLTNEMKLINKNSSPSKYEKRSSSVSVLSSIDQHRSRSNVRFNPTDYIQQKNIKLKQIQLKKKNKTDQQLNSGKCQSDSDLSDLSDTNPKKHSKQKQTNHRQRRKSENSIDSDIERLSSPIILRKPISNTSTMISPPDVNSNSINNINEIDQRLRSLEKFIKQNFLH